MIFKTWYWFLMSRISHHSLWFGVNNSSTDFKPVALLHFIFQSVCKFAMQTLRSRSEDWLMKAVQIIPWFPRYFAHKCCSFILPWLSWFCFCCLLVAHLTASFLLCYCPSSSAFISYDTGWCEMFTHGALGLQFSCNMLMQSQFIIPISVFAVWLGSRCSMGV